MAKHTESQKQAIESFGKNTIVSAGAGSGKTRVLSDRVKYLFENRNISVENMLILTFTNLAAKEMKDRIRNKLKSVSLEEANKVLTADICTFDSFALGLVKKYHLLLGLDENINIVSSQVIVEKRKKWIDQLFDELYEKEDAQFIEAIDKLVYDDDDKIKDLIAEVIAKSSLSLSIEDYFSPTTEEEKERIFAEAIKVKEAELNLQNIELQNLLEDVTIENYALKAKEVNDELFRARTIDEYYEFSLKKVKANSVSKKDKEDYDEDDFEKVDIFAEARSKFVKELKKLKPKSQYEEEFYNSFKIKDYFKSLAKIIYDKEMAFKYGRQVFEFQDISNFAYKLVKEKESIRKELTEKYKIIMVDEYQDTSFSQERFLKLIENSNLFMVGDIKQSIYRFRNARPDLFQEKYEKYASNIGGEKIDMNENFRSRANVLEDINVIFKNIMTDEYGSANYARDHIILPGNKDYDNLKVAVKDTTALIYEKNDKMTNAEIEATLIAEDILSKIDDTYVLAYENDAPVMKKVGFSSFCILIDRGTEFPTYMRIFEEKGIPLFVQDNEKISDNYLVRITQNVLLIIKKILNIELDEEFNHLFVSLARSFVFDYDDKKIYEIVKSNSYKDDYIFKTLLNIIDKQTTNSLEELITTFFEEINIYEKLFKIGSYEKNKTYLNSFLSYFKEMDMLNYSLEEAAEFIKNIAEYKIKLELPSQSTSEDAVRIMNVHKSKGLEFPIVYFAGLNKGFNKEEFKKKEMVSNRFGMIFSFDNGEKTIDYIANKILEEKDDLSEKIRLFYVALTRAREQMIFVYPNTDKVVELEKSNCFLDFIENSKLSFKTEYIDAKGIINSPSASLKDEKLTYEVIDFSPVKDETKAKASKILSLDSSSSLMRLGSNIHFLFKVADFKTRDISMFNEEDQTILNRFYSSELFDKVKDGKIYKEYEFETETSKGIIDMFAVLENKIILVDYKLKNLSDEAYVDQLSTYADFLTNAFNKPVEAYLYSIFTGEDKKVI